MTDDLVKQLPEYHNLTVESADIFKVIEARLAASSKDKTDRIEKLEAALQAVIRYAGNAGDDYLADKARKALEGKDD